MEAHFHTPLESRLRSVFSTTPSTGKTMTPISTGRTTVTPVSPRFPGKRDIIHRLRQQLKGRDEMIMHMQAQVLEQGRLIHAHQLRIGDLEELLRTTNRSLFEAEQEVDHLRTLLAESCTCRPASCQVRKRACPCDGQVRVKDSPAQKQRLFHPGQDMAVLVTEARRLTEELRLASEAKRQRERVNLSLACDLAEARELAHKNAALYEACEEERAKLSNVLADLQHKLQSQAVKLEHIRAHTIGLTSTAEAKATGRCEDLCTSTVVQSSSRNSQFSTESSASFRPVVQPMQDCTAERSVTNLLSALEHEVDRLHAQLVKLTNHEQTIGESQLQARQLVPSQVKQLATKLEEVASLQAPHLARHKNTILALKEKVSLLSENSDFLSSWTSGLDFSMENSPASGEMCALVTHRTKQQFTSGGVVPESAQAAGSWSTMSDDRTSMGDEMMQPPEVQDPTRWSVSEEAARFLAEVEHLMKSTPEKYEASKFPADVERKYDQEQLQDEMQAADADTGEQVARLSAEMEDIQVTDEKGVDSYCSMGASRTSLGDQGGDATKGSFGRFVFDMEQDNEAMMLNKGDSGGSRNSSYRCSRPASQAAERRAGSAPGALSPFSKMMAKLDLLNSSTAVPLTDSLVVAERVERSIGSLESAFEKALSNNSNSNVVELCSPFKFSVTSSSSNNNSSSSSSSSSVRNAKLMV